MSLDQEKPLSEFSTGQLQAVLDGRSKAVGLDRAVSVLLQRSVDAPLPIVEQILRTQKTPETRIAGLNSLGKRVSAEGQEFLLNALTTKDPQETRAAVWALAKTADAKALSVLDRHAKSKSKDIERTIRRAQRLIGFRNGLDQYRFAPGDFGKVPRLKREKTTPMKIAALSEEKFALHAKRIREEAPADKFQFKTALEMTCQRKTLWLVGTEQLGQGAEIDRVLEKPTVPMAIFGYAYCSDRPYLYGYVLSQPTKTGADLLITRSKGQETHVGKLSADRNGLKFQLDALSTRFAPAARIAGRIDRQKGLEVSEALVSTDVAPVAKLRRAPQLVKAVPQRPSEPAN